MERADDFKDRRKHLADLTEKQLEEKFWNLAEEIIDPIIELAEKNTTPSIERSVLLRMGFSSPEAKTIVDGILDRGLIGKGAGHIVYRLAEEKDIEVREAGLKLLDGDLWDDAVRIFEEGDK